MALDWPKKPITISCTSGPGSSFDVMVRNLAEHMTKHIGVPVMVINKTGGAGTVNMSYIKSLPADGYTLLTEACVISLNLLRKDVQDLYMHDFEPLACIHMDPYVVFVKEDSPYKTLADLVGAAKKNPGKLTLAGYGTMMGQHLTVVALGKEAGVDWKWMAYNSGNEAIAALLGGHVDAASSNSSYFPQFKGKIRALAHSQAGPLKLAPDVPSFRDLGYKHPYLQTLHCRGLFVKAGTPRPIMEKLHQAISKAMQEPGFVDFTEKSGLITGFCSLEEFRKIIKEYADAHTVLLGMLGIELKEW